MDEGWGDNRAGRAGIRGRHRAHGAEATWSVIIIGRFEGDKLVEDWVEYDRYNLFRQLGAV